MNDSWIIRKAQEEDWRQIQAIYNQGIEDRIATLEEQPKSLEEVLKDRSSRYVVLVAIQGGEVYGWASLNPYSYRCAYSGVVDLSVYVDRNWRGKGVGSRLLNALESEAQAHHFHKMIHYTLPFNKLGQGLYRKCGFREVGVLQNQGVLDGRFVDVLVMEKCLSPSR
ncbi:arsinothricin resistance N-acetyltransferase ArsN1 family A [Melghirimyces algeriensis]|uniref:Phosphinothricin acetyltransferase n=1 Tax=Melghirimyces algeriensis TaxID=910412 RepID=A0A521CD57_9BACL|nr:arsinothricin resistance N-acetyltransferase ArsN1 family A [Melghirimyces algeriensis]SMO57315.1 phosphinothricin acetyltransferase [Melghirimyces algeriensis]